MLRLIQKYNIRRVMASVLALLMFVSVFASVKPLDVKADSNDLRRTYLNLMAGKDLTDIEDVNSLSVEDLRCTALFLSNYYIPWGTALDEAESDVTSSNKSDMVSILETVGFKKEAAEQLVDNVYQASLKSAQKLYFDWEDAPFDSDKDKDDDSSTYSKGDKRRFGLGSKLGDPGVGEKTIIDNDNYHSLTGDLVEADSTKYSPLTVWEWWICFRQHNHGKGYNLDLYWDNGGTMQKAFVINDEVRNFYASMLSSGEGKHAKQFTALNKGFCGNALGTFKTGDTNSKRVVEDADGNEVALDSVAATFIFTENIYVDWVGNILADLGTHRVVIYPASVNPYAFSKIGTATSSDAIEPIYNFTSVQGIQFINRFTEANDTEDSCTYEVTEAYTPVKTKFTYNRGSNKSATWDTEWNFFGIGGNTDVAKGLKDFLDEEDEGLGGIVEGDDWGDEGSDNDNTDIHLKVRKWTIESDMAIMERLIYKDIPNIDSFDDDTLGSQSFVRADGFSGYNDNSKSSGNIKKYNLFSSVSTFAEGDYKLFTPQPSDSQTLADMFVTYAFAYANKDAVNNEKFDDDVTKYYVNMKFNDVFPTADMKALEWETSSHTSEKIMSFVYYLLHPVEGASYVATLFKNKVSGIIVGWHEDTVGSSDSNYTTGMTKYLGFTGYATSPSLYDIDWIAGILDTYNNLIVYVIILLCVILLCYVLIGALTIQRGIIGVFCFAILAFLPPVAINASVDMINSTCDRIYSSKFDYWAICQLEGYIPKLNEINSANTVNDYISSLMEMRTVNDSVAGESETGYSGVKLKWMTPKKFRDTTVTDELENSSLSSTFSPTFIHVLSNGLSSTSSKEEFVTDALYLYRDYLDIYRYSSASYNLYSSYNAYDYIKTTYQNCLNSSNSTKNYNSIVYNWGTLSQNYSKRNGLAKTTPLSLQYTSGQPLYQFVLSNVENYKSSSYNYNNIMQAAKDTSSLNAIRHGFLYNTVGYTGSGEYEYYNQEGTLATSLYTNFCQAQLRVHGNRMAIDEDIEKGMPDIRKDTITSEAYYYGVPPRQFSMDLNRLLSWGNRTGDIYLTDSVKIGEPDPDNKTSGNVVWTQLSGYYYALYTESPYYYFNFNVRDQLTKCDGSNYVYNPKLLNQTNSNLSKMWLKDDLSYFYNLEPNAGDGYGELRDYMNFHDLFYYIIPSMAEGNYIVDKFDEYFGMYTFDDCTLKINNDGTISYDGEVYKSIGDLKLREVINTFDDEELYKFWHDYNVYTLFNSYTTWLDAMEDCDYAKPETITVAGEDFRVENPLDPTTYYELSDTNYNSGTTVTKGRYMVFSRSEMAYYGLDWSQLTEVERKIITIQDNVFNKTLNLMNYYTLSDETLITEYSMIQLFEFNKEFSQSNVIGESYELFPQGYELKAFTYDSYLRLIVAEASGDEIQSADGTSIYTRVISKTSLFFGICLLVNDFIAVYLIPGLKIAFLIALFFSSIALIISSAVKMELNIAVAAWKSLISPLLSYALISVGMAWIVSLFMSNGAQGVVQTGKTVTLGDPTMAIIAMIIINTAVLVLYWKVVKKCVKDVITYSKALATSIGGAVGGALGTVAAGAFKGKQSGKGQYSGSASNSASQRGKDNAPNGKGSSGNLGRSLAGGALGGAIAGDMLSETAKEEINRANAREDARKGMNKYDQKAMEKSEAKEDKYREKMDKALHKAEMAENKGKDGKAERLLNRAAKNEGKMNRARSYQKNIQEVGRVGAFKKAASGSLGSAASKGSAIAGTVKTKASKGVGAVRSGEVGAKLGSSARKAVNGTKAVGRAISETPTAVRRTASNIKKGAQEGTKKVAKAVGTGATIGHSIGEAGKETLRNVGNGMSSAYKNNVKGFKAGYQNS